MLEDNVGMTQMPEEWSENIPLPDIPNFDPEWNEKYFMRKNLLPDIYRHFDEYGVEYFKDLNVWHIPQLRDKLNGSPWAHELSFHWEKEINVSWLLPYIDNNLPDDYGDDFIRECMQGCIHPWELWIKMLINSD